MFLADSILNDQITISITVEQLIAWVIIGLIAGLVASIFFRGRISLFGLLIVGLLGSVVGGFIFFDLLDIVVTGELAGGIMIRWIDMLVSIVGAIIVMALTSPLYYWRRRV